ncbi:hypothetical protein M4D79_06930 [Mycolicibacterium novocastrense]|nr:hypothetical protein M4D79_06930 [Mycolicibacterium novocastrense]
MIDTGAAFGLTVLVTRLYRERRNPRLRDLPGVAMIGGVPVAGSIRLERRALLHRERSTDLLRADGDPGVLAVGERLTELSRLGGRDEVKFVSQDGRLAARAGLLFADRLPVRQPLIRDGGRDETSGDGRPLLVGVLSASWRWHDAERFANELAADDKDAQMILAFD